MPAPSHGADRNEVPAVDTKSELGSVHHPLQRRPRKAAWPSGAFTQTQVHKHIRTSWTPLTNAAGPGRPVPSWSAAYPRKRWLVVATLASSPPHGSDCHRGSSGIPKRHRARKAIPCRYLIHSPLRRNEIEAIVTIVRSERSRHISPCIATNKDWITKKKLKGDHSYF